MSNPIDSSSEEITMWRKRIPLKLGTLKRLEDEARSSVRTPEGMAAYIIEEYFKTAAWKPGMPDRRKIVRFGDDNE